MKLFSFFLLMLGINSLLQATGITFQDADSWEEVVEMATAQNKHIFVDGFATWCGPCKKMSKEVFSDESVGSWYDKNFLSVKLDMEKEGIGKTFADQHNVRAYPTLMFFSPTGEFLHRVAGYHDVAQFVEIGMNAMDPKARLSSMINQFEKGSTDPTFLYTYAEALDNAAMDSEQAVIAYLKTQSEKELMSEKNWKLISTNLHDVSSPYFKKVLSMQDQLSEKYGKNEVKTYLARVYSYKMRDVAKSQDYQELVQLKKEISSTIPRQQYELNAKADYVFYRQDETKSHEFAVKYFDRYSESARDLNKVAWTYFETIDDEQKLEKALNWVNRSIAIEEKWYNTDTKANLLYKLNRLPAAKEAAEHSIQLAKEQGEMPEETEALLNSINTAIENSIAK